MASKCFGVWLVLFFTMLETRICTTQHSTITNDQYLCD
uniref:Uncharacterized protein n=1 Tax=Arundo donax TaxID=35708 RepID=A0A0A8YKB8_ARUDO